MDTGTQPPGPTFHGDEHLPPLPLPALEDSVRGFLAWCAPLLDPAERARTEAAAAAFLAPGGPAHALQADLEDHAARKAAGNWLERFWTHRYLSVRGPIAPDENFVMLFEDGSPDQAERAAGLLVAAAEYKLLLDQEQVPPTLQRGRALSMDQYKRLFSTTRIPDAAVDVLRAPYTAAHPGPSRARHVVVLHRGRAFRLDVLDGAGRPHGTAAVAAALRAVLAAPAADGQDPFVGALTTLPRALWAEHRRALLELSPRNAEALEAVETALLCLTLAGDAPRDAREAGERLLHGDGADRWFDKSVSLVVYPDGRAGLSGEHSVLDGTTVLAFAEAVLERAARHRPGRAPGTPCRVEALAVELDDRLRSAVREAASSFAARGAQLVTALTAVEDAGTQRFKQLGISPDAVVQLAFQLAHRRARGYVGSVYEPVAVRHFRLGRTETLRTVTPESLRLLAAMQDPAADAEQCRAALRAAADAHVGRARSCQEQLGPERHLWTLQQLHRERAAHTAAGPEPELYRSPGWRVLRDDCLSTSSMPARRVRFSGFAPTTPRCLGVAYQVAPERTGLFVSAPRACEDELARFVEEFGEAVLQLRDLLAGQPPAAPPR